MFKQQQIRNPQKEIQSLDLSTIQKPANQDWMTSRYLKLKQSFYGLTSQHLFRVLNCGQHSSLHLLILMPTKQI